MDATPRSEGSSTPTVPATALQHCQFHGVTLDAIEEGGKVWVGIRAVCDALGIDSQAQQRRIGRQGWGESCVAMMAAQVGGQRRAIACIELDALPMWLATIEVSRVKPEQRERLVLFQREATRALRDHFLGRAQGAVEPAGGDALASRVVELACVVQVLGEEVARLSRRRRARAKVPALQAPTSPLQQVIDQVKPELREYIRLWVEHLLWHTDGEAYPQFKSPPDLNDRIYDARWPGHRGGKIVHVTPDALLPAAPRAMATGPAPIPATPLPAGQPRRVLTRKEINKIPY